MSESIGPSSHGIKITHYPEFEGIIVSESGAGSVDLSYEVCIALVEWLRQHGIGE